MIDECQNEFNLYTEEHPVYLQDIHENISDVALFRFFDQFLFFIFTTTEERICILTNDLWSC